MSSSEICKFSKKTFLTEQLEWLLLRFNSCFQMSPEQKLVRLSAINTIFSGKKVFDVSKITKQLPSLFCRACNIIRKRLSNIAKFSRTLIFKNICKRLLLKISISVGNSEAIFQRLISWLVYDRIVLSCNMFCQVLSDTAFFSGTNDVFII